MNENREKELEKLPEIETEIVEEKEEIHISEIEEDISQVEKIPEELEDTIDTDENIEEELEKESKEEFEEDTLSSENSEEILSELEIEIIGNDGEEPQIPQEITKEDLKIQLKELRRNLIEGALYAAGRPLDVEELSTKLEIPKKEVEELVRVVAFDYLECSGALIVAQIGEKYQMQLRPELTETVSKFAKGGAIAERYLRTLTIIALKQPILKSTVIKLRGSGAYEHVKYLLENDLISAIKKGRSAELATTDKYADMFGLPKNKEELKRMMVSQLGLEENTN
ncbi:MAG: SMC-Scp complex subunit ScpB [Promethearchaeota archaeon Loki_b31]|nr:MAG: SMC-Scp complex subunit ScpB [Candidatus Lokiarchaeota archaeon Loki_b31]